MIRRKRGVRIKSDTKRADVIAYMRTLADSPIEVPSRDLMMPLAQVTGFYLGNWMARQSPLKLLGVLRAVKRLTVEGVFHTEVTDTYPLDQVATALQASLEPGRTGKVMLSIGSR